MSFACPLALAANKPSALGREARPHRGCMCTPSAYILVRFAGIYLCIHVPRHGSVSGRTLRGPSGHVVRGRKGYRCSLVSRNSGQSFEQALCAFVVVPFDEASRACRVGRHGAYRASPWLICQLWLASPHHAWSPWTESIEDGMKRHVFVALLFHT